MFNPGTGTSTILTFYDHYLLMFVPGKLFQPNLMCASKARAYLRGASFEHLGKLLASSASIRLGWKGLPETNTLTYSENS